MFKFIFNLTERQLNKGDIVYEKKKFQKIVDLFNICVMLTYRRVIFICIFIKSTSRLSGTFHLVPILNDEVWAGISVSTGSRPSSPSANHYGKSTVTVYKYDGTFASVTETVWSTSAMEAWAHANNNKLSGVVRGTGSHSGTANYYNQTQYPMEYASTEITNPYVG